MTAEEILKLQKRVNFLIKAGENLLLENKELQQQCQKRDELIKAMDEYIHLLICSSYPENNVTTQDFMDSESKIEQLKSEIQ
jgi:hypothetical protein